jgi:hypothetical protein
MCHIDILDMNRKSDEPKIRKFLIIVIILIVSAITAYSHTYEKRYQKDGSYRIWQIRVDGRSRPVSPLHRDYKITTDVLKLTAVEKAYVAPPEIKEELLPDPTTFKEISDGK